MELNADTLQPDRALELLDDALGKVPGPAELAVTARRELSCIREPSAGSASESAGAELVATARVWREGRCGHAVGRWCTRVDLHRLLSEASAQAPAGPALALPSAAFARPAGPSPGGERSGAKLERVLASLEAGLAASGAVVQAMLARQDDGWVAVASSIGVRSAQWTPSQRVMVRCDHRRGALVDGVEEGSLASALEVGQLIERLQRGAEALAGEGGAPDPSLPWLLAPHAAASLVSGLGWLLSGDTAAALPGLARTHGKKIFPACLNVVDGPGVPARHVDDEGQPVPELTLVREGRLEQFAHSSESGASLKQPPNGRAVRIGGAGLPFARLRAPTVLPGSGQWPADRNELEARLETFVVGPRAGKVLLTLAGFVVRGGARCARIAPFEVELPVLDSFRGLLQVGADAAHFPTVDGARTPSLLIPPPRSRS